MALTTISALSSRGSSRGHTDGAEAQQQGEVQGDGSVPSIPEHRPGECVFQEFALFVACSSASLFLKPPSFGQGNLKDDSELAAKIPALMKLKRAIYSPEYRSFVEKLAGLEPGTLTDEVRPQGKCRMTRNHPKTQHPNTGRLRRQLPREGMPPALPRRRHRNAQSLLHHLPDRPVPDVDRRGRRTSRTLRRHPRR